MGGKLAAGLLNFVFIMGLRAQMSGPRCSHTERHFDFYIHKFVHNTLMHKRGLLHLQWIETIGSRETGETAYPSGVMNAAMAMHDIIILLERGQTFK